MVEQSHPFICKVYVLIHSVKIHVLIHSVKIYVLIHSVKIRVLIHSVKVHVVIHSVKVHVLIGSVKDSLSPSSKMINAISCFLTIPFLEIYPTDTVTYIQI